MSSFPSVIASITDPQASDRLNSPSHSGLHQTENDEIEQTQRVIGTSASTIGTIIGDLRNPASDGGGHVQTAVKGGTGQVTYTKGDILVASGPSVLTKLAIGTDGQILTANSSVATGIGWAVTPRNKLGTSASAIGLTNSTAQTSLMSVTVPGSTIGTSNAIRATLFVKNLKFDDSNEHVTFKAFYGTSSFATLVINPSATNSSSIIGTIQPIVIGRNSVSSQLGILKMDLFSSSGAGPTSVFGGLTSVMSRYVSTQINEDSGASKVFGVTAQWNAAEPAVFLDIDGYIAEQIT